jgi:hypothetical protein
LRGARREKREALDWMKRQIEALLDDPATTRRALRDRRYTIALRAEAGPPWPE